MIWNWSDVQKRRRQCEFCVKSSVSIVKNGVANAACPSRRAPDLPDALLDLTELR